MRLERSARQGGHLTRHAVHTQAVRQVGRELEREQSVVKVQVLANILAQRRAKCQFKQAAVVFRDLKLARRTQHSLAFNTAQLPNLDEKRLAIFARWQDRTNQRARHLDANPRIGCAANDVEQGSLPHINLAHLQLVCIRVLDGGLDFTDDYF